MEQKFFLLQLKKLNFPYNKLILIALTKKVFNYFYKLDYEKCIIKT